MAEYIFYPDREGDVTPYTSNLVVKLTDNGNQLATLLGIAPADITMLQQIVAGVPARINDAQVAEDTAKGLTAVKQSVLKDARLTTLNMLQIWSRNANWTHEIGRSLGVYIERTPVDLDTVKPRITNVDVHPDMVIIDWVRGRMDGVAVYGSLDGSNFHLIDKDLKSPWEDRTPNRTPGAELRYYKLRYLKGDKEVGLFSDVVSALVSIGGSAAPVA
jgi:hypothetical protein